MFSFMANNQRPFLQEFSGFYILFSFQGSLLSFSRQLVYYITLAIACQQLFQVFFKLLFQTSGAVSKDALLSVRLSLSLKDKAYLSTTFDKSQHLFYKVFQIVLTAYTIYKSYVFIVHFYYITNHTIQISRLKPIEMLKRHRTMCDIFHRYDASFSI